MNFFHICRYTDKHTSCIIYYTWSIKSYNSFSTYYIVLLPQVQVFVSLTELVNILNLISIHSFTWSANLNYSCV